ncbi:flavin reductase family protein [Rhodococcus sp. WS3]|uniref:flavin reductase family protein n=1 Tax=Rhodococcus sp. WS3 TaxID=2486271 RepID=UPI0021CA944A
MTPSEVGPALSALGIGLPHNGTEACVATDWIRSQAPVREDQGWAARFQSMLDYADTKGWMAENGQFVIGHIDTGEPEGLDAQTLRRGFGRSPSSVTAVCSHSSSGPVGMVVSTMVPVSLDPPIVSICIQLTSQTWPTLRDTGRLGLSVLSEGNHAAAMSLAAKDGDRFGGLDYSTSESGAVHITDSSLRMEVSVQSEIVAGDHLIALLDVHSLDEGGAVAPLVFHQSQLTALSSC